MNKKKLYIIILVIGICLLNACRADGVPVILPEDESETALLTQMPTVAVEPKLTQNPQDSNSIIDEYSDDEIMKISFELAEQMAKGEFNETAMKFSEAVKEKLDEESLQTVWDSTVLLIGGYKGVEKDLYYMDRNGDFVVCYIILRYEKSGLSVTLTFNKSFEIDGLNINYYIFDEDAEEESIDERERAVLIGTPDYPIEGILTLPENIENPPVVILVQGSGQSDMDATIGTAGNKPFRDIARGLADNGIASIRYNKRFYVYPERAEITSTIYDEVLDDAAGAVRLASQDGRVDADSIYIAGHSLGGMLAPKIAEMNPEVKGIISLAGSPRNLEDIIYDQNKEAIMQLNNYSEDELNSILSEVMTMVWQVKNLSDENLAEPILGATGYYWKSLNEINTAQIAMELEIPMLFLQGSEDFQVYPEVDYAMWQDILSDRENVRFCLYEGLNHLFMPSTGLRSIKDYDTKSNVSEKVINDIAEWILTGDLTEE